MPATPRNPTTCPEPGTNEVTSPGQVGDLSGPAPAMEVVTTLVAAMVPDTAHLSAGHHTIVEHMFDSQAGASSRPAMG
jgi:hypothetical protein